MENREPNKPFLPTNQKVINSFFLTLNKIARRDHRFAISN